MLKTLAGNYASADTHVLYVLACFLRHFNMHNSNSEHSSAPVQAVTSTDTLANDVTVEDETVMPVTPESKPVKPLNADPMSSDTGTVTGVVGTKSDDSKSFHWWGRSNKVCAQRLLV
jgi:hypothetical protein